MRSGFLWFPKTIGGETRWLEWARWEEEYAADWDGSWWWAVAWLPNEAREGR